MAKRGNGQGSVYPERGRWVAAVTYEDLEGRRRRKQRVAPTERAAKALLKELLGAVEGGASLDRDSTVSDVVGSWLAVAQDKVRPSTYDSYETMARRWLVPAIGHLKARALQPEHVRVTLRAAAEAGLSPASVRYVRKILGMALRHAMGERAIVRNVVESVPGPGVPRAEIAPFTAAELARLFAAIEGNRLEPLVTVVVSLGLRVSEALGLRWQDVDLEFGVLQVRVQLLRQDGDYVLREPKSRSGRRDVGLPAVARSALQRQRVRQLEERLAAGNAWRGERLGLVFTLEDGSPLHRRTVLRWFQQTLEREGLPVRGLKELRHTAASLLHAQGATARDVMETLGHSDVRVTLNTYTHLFEERKHAIAARMDAALAAPRG